LTRSFLRLFSLLLLTIGAAIPALAAIGTGSLSTGVRSAVAAPTHAWIALPEPDGTGCAVFHLPPRGMISDLTGLAQGALVGEARVAASIASNPVALGSIGPQVAMVFADGGAGFPNLNGRPVLALEAIRDEAGVWRALPGQRLDSLPSLRADGLLLGFTGSPVGYAALFQGLAGKSDDPKSLLLQVLTRDGWVDVMLLAEAQTLAGPHLKVLDGKPSTDAFWRLMSTDRGLAVVFIPPRKASEPIAGSVFLADFSGSPNDAKPSATWTRRDLTLVLPGSIPTDQIEVTTAADHLVLTALMGGGKMAVYTQPFAAPTAWRGTAEVQNVAPEHIVLPLDGVSRIGVVSIAKSKEPGGLDLRMTEVSVRTGAVAYEGELNIASPITPSDYRFMAIAMAWVLGLIVVFLWRPAQKAAQHLPPGVSIAEPGRRMIAALIDAAVAVLIACRVMGLPLVEFLNSGVWANGPAQDTLLIAVGILVVAGTVLETLFGRTLGKLLAGCGVIEMSRGVPKKGENDEPRAPVYWRAAIRNLIKWGLPPVALFGLLDPAGRHRADQLAGTAVVVEGEEEPEDEPEA
jgi:hypothetical protein